MLAQPGADWPRAWPPANPPSTNAAALAGALSALADATDAVALAVRRHDHTALVEANLRADALLADVGRTMAAIGPDDKQSLEAAGVSSLVERLGASGRRNAYLIERAWATDAAMLRLLAGLGRQGVEGTAAGYGAPAGPAYLDRQA